MFPAQVEREANTEQVGAQEDGEGGPREDETQAPHKGQRSACLSLRKRAKVQCQ